MKALIFLTLITFISHVAGSIQIKKRRPKESSELVAGATTKFTAKVRLSRQDIDAGTTIDSTYFEFKHSGIDATVESVPGELKTRKKPNARAFNYFLDKTLSDGGTLPAGEEWQWRVHVTDSSDVSKTSGWFSTTTIGEVTPTASPSPTGSGPRIAGASEAIENLLSTQDNRAMGMRAKFVRLGFHDCVGGCDGCIDLDNIDNAGLGVPINALTEVVDEFAVNDLTRADIWALAAMIGAETSTPRNGRLSYDFQWYGRPDGNCIAGVGEDDHTLPSPDFNTTGLLHFFSTEFNFTARQTAALMGAHSIGTLSQDNSGFDGPNGWDRNNNMLNNGYYDVLVGGNRNAERPEDNEETYLLNARNWNQRPVNNSASDTIPNRMQWVNGGGNGGNGGNGNGGNGNVFNANGNAGGNQNRGPLVMTNSDMALVRDFTDFTEQDSITVSCRFKNGRNNNNNVCPHAGASWDAMIEFKFDNDAFLSEFHAVFMAVLHHGSNVTGALVGCGDGLYCPIPASVSVTDPSPAT